MDLPSTLEFKGDFGCFDWVTVLPVWSIAAFSPLKEDILDMWEAESSLD